MKLLPQFARSFREGFMDGLGAGLFVRLRRPGAPDELIIQRDDEGFDDHGSVRYPHNILHPHGVTRSG